MQHAGQTAKQGGYDVDPEIVVDGAFLHVDGERGDEKSDDDLQNFVIHFFLSCRTGFGLSVSNYTIENGIATADRIS